MSESVKLILLVAGFDYDQPTNPKNGLDFQERCRNRLYEIIHQLEETKDGKPLGLTLPTRLRFLLFDMVKGEIKVFDHMLVAEKTSVKRVTDPWQPLSTITTGDPYDPNKFVNLRVYRAPMAGEFVKSAGDDHPHFEWGKAPNPDQVMSIVDIYKSVRKAPAGSILELSIFSHGYLEGPILLNSSEREEDPPSPIRYKSDKVNRDPQDFDGRGYKDFLKTMEGGAGAGDLLTPFKSAFDAKNGVIRIWGCFHSEPSKQYIRAVARAIPKALRKGAVPDSTPLVIKTEKRGTLSYPLGSFLRFLAEKKVIVSYSYLAAANTGIRTFGAVPGPGSEDEKTGARLMRINKGYAELLRFYEKFLGIGHDERLYGVYDDKALQRIKELLTFNPVIPPSP